MSITEAVVSAVQKLNPELLKKVSETVPQEPKSVPQDQPLPTFDPSQFVADMKVLCNANVQCSVVSTTTLSCDV
jgi:hypothetical protein